MITKSAGVTHEEEYLKRLCDGTFLSMWSYPNIYRNQGIKNQGEGKELCDLLVVFDNHVIIFSDKHCTFPENDDLELAWGRWFRKTVVESANQAWGAARWIQSFPSRLFLDKSCKQPFPIELGLNKEIKFHLIVVSHGVTGVCSKILGGSGSLMLNSQLAGEAQHTVPFTIGDLDPQKLFIHVLDDTSLEIVLKPEIQYPIF